MGKGGERETELRPESAGKVPVAYARVARIDWAGPAGNRSVLVTSARVIGSATTADIAVEDPAVSRIHAEIEPRESGVWIRDLGSKNGTFVHGVRVESACVPHLGRVKIGGTDLVVTYGAASAQPQPWPEASFGPLRGASRAMRELFGLLAKVAAGDAPVLVTGETGTGKELVARAIHERSARKDKPLVVVDCAALAESLLEAELFGHAKGAFTGAVSARAGAIEAADGGTVFLDEIGELPRSMQPKLLRVLEARTVRRVGETQHRDVDVRFVAATHRDLLRMVNTSEFREDLYFRLAVLPVRVPPLRERLDDIELLVRHFLGTQAQDELSPDFLAELRALPWRGNVRELRNYVERVKTLGSFTVSPPLDAAEAPPTSLLASSSTADAPSFDQPYRSFRDAWHEHGERAYVEKLLARHGQKVPLAAAAAEIDRTYLYKLIRKYER